MTQPRQPFLHDLLTVLAAPTQVLSTQSGQIGRDGAAIGAQGILHADLRIVSALELTVEVSRRSISPPCPPNPVSRTATGWSSATWSAASGPSCPTTPIPSCAWTANAPSSPGRCGESYLITSQLPAPVTVRLRLALAYDLASIGVIRAGDQPPARVFPAPDPSRPVLGLRAGPGQAPRARGPGRPGGGGASAPADLGGRGTRSRRRPGVGWTATVTDQGRWSGHPSRRRSTP